MNQDARGSDCPKVSGKVALSSAQNSNTAGRMPALQDSANWPRCAKKVCPAQHMVPYEARLRRLLVMILNFEISVQRGDAKMLLLVRGDFGFVDQRETDVVEAL